MPIYKLAHLPFVHMYGFIIFLSTELIYVLMILIKKQLIVFWHFPCLGFLSSILVFVFGQIINSINRDEFIGNGLIAISRYLFNPAKGQLIYKKQTENLYNNTLYRIILKILYFPLELILSILLLVQSLILIVSIYGLQLGININKISIYVFYPERVRYVMH